MLEAEDYYHSKAAEQPQCSQEDLDVVEQRMSVLHGIREASGGQLQPEWFYLNMQRRLIGNNLKMGTEINAENIEKQFLTIKSEVKGNEKVAQGVAALRWAFLRYAVSYDQKFAAHWLNMYAFAEQFNEMQKVHMQQTGQALEEVSLDNQQTQALSWLLDHAGIPHEAFGQEAHIALAPLEQGLREAATTYAEHYLNDPSDKDHEAKTDVSAAMEQWKQQGDTGSNGK